MRADTPLTDEQRARVRDRARTYQRNRYRNDAEYRGKRIVENRARNRHVPRGTVKQHEYVPAILDWLGLA